MDFSNGTTTYDLCPIPPNETLPVIDDLKFYLSGILLTFVVIAGLIGNTISVLVLCSHHMKTSSTSVYLTGLAIWDSVLLIFATFMIGIANLEQRTTTKFYTTKVMGRIFPYIYPIALTAQTSTIYITVCLTIERWIAVIFPLKAHRYCTTKRARIAILVISFTSLLFNTIRFLEYKTAFCTDPVSGETNSLFTLTALGNMQILKHIYYEWFYGIFMSVLPICLLMFFNAMLIRAFHGARQEQKALNVRQKRENNLTLMLISVVVVFILCQTPALVYNVLYPLKHTPKEKNAPGMQILSHVRNFLVILNSATNFILYYAMGKKFRTTLLTILCCRDTLPANTMTYKSDNLYRTTRSTNNNTLCRPKMINDIKRPSKPVKHFRQTSGAKRQIDRAYILPNSDNSESFSNQNNLLLENEHTTLSDTPPTKQKQQQRAVNEESLGLKTTCAALTPKTYQRRLKFIDETTTSNDERLELIGIQKRWSALVPGEERVLEFHNTYRIPTQNTYRNPAKSSRKQLTSKHVRITPPISYAGNHSPHYCENSNSKPLNDIAEVHSPPCSPTSDIALESTFQNHVGSISPILKNEKTRSFKHQMVARESSNRERPVSDYFGPGMMKKIKPKRHINFQVFV